MQAGNHKPGSLDMSSAIHKKVRTYHSRGVHAFLCECGEVVVSIEGTTAGLGRHPLINYSDKPGNDPLCWPMIECPTFIRRALGL